MTCPSCGAGYGEWHHESCRTGGGQTLGVFMPDEAETSPSVAQWARAEALRSAAQVLSAAVAADVAIKWTDVEALAYRWTKWIETGEAVNP